MNGRSFGRFWSIVVLAGCLVSSCTTYSCGAISCQATAVWQVGQLPSLLFRGFATAMSTVQLNGGDGVITSEVWVEQTSSCGQAGTCWIEAGLSAGTSPCIATASETHYFWADNRPDRGYLCRDLGAVQPQEIGNPSYLIFAVYPPQPNTFSIEVISCSDPNGTATGCTPRSFLGQSTQNAMIPDVVLVGMSLVGSQGASSGGINRFVHNTVVNPGSPVGWSWVTVDALPNLTQQGPIHFSQDVLPSSPGSDGGQYSVSCCGGP